MLGLKIALRTLARAPSFALGVVLTLGLAIGATTAVFSVVRGILLAPLAFRQPDQLVRLYNSNAQASGMGAISPVEYRDDYKPVKGLSAIGAWTGGGANLTTSAEPVHVSVGMGTASLLPTLGVAPALGRWFAEEEEQPGRDKVIVLGPSLWRSRFGADPTVVGRSIDLDGQPVRIVGVLPFDLELSEQFDAWVPLATPAPNLTEAMRNHHYFRVVGRLGAPLEQVRAELLAVAARVQAAHPQHYPPAVRRTMIAIPLHENLVGGVRETLWMLFAAVSLVLLMACVNTGNLLLARAAARNRELAVRAALGADGAALARQTLLESLLLSAAGGALGILVAAWGVDLLGALGAVDLPRAKAVRVDLVVLAFAVGASLFSGLLFGLLPAIAAAKADLQSAFRTASSSAAPQAARLRRALVVVGVALALMLVAAASLLIRSFANVVRIDPGFQPKGAISLRVALARSDDRDEGRARSAAFYQQALQQLRGVPGVTAVGAIDNLPLTASYDRFFDIEGRERPPGTQRLHADIRVVTAGYFQAVGQKVLRGRPIDDGDGAGKPRAVVINSAFERKHFGGDALGKRIAIDAGAWTEIVGIVDNVREHSLEGEPIAIMYFPHGQLPRGAMSFVLRSPRPLADVARAAQEVLAGLDRGLPSFAVQPLSELVAGALSERAFALALVQAFAFVALLLAALGLYGVLAYAVAQRTREIGVRMALGAARGNVVALVARESAGLVGAGMLLGAVGAFAATRGLGAHLYGIGALDPLSLAAAALVLAAVCAVATLLPARRASRVDPAIALKAE